MGDPFGSIYSCYYGGGKTGYCLTRREKPNPQKKQKLPPPHQGPCHLFQKQQLL